MLDIENINETDQSAIITEERITCPENIPYPSEEDMKICISNLKNLDPDSTLEEKLQFCRMVCTEDENAGICSKLIESDNQVI